MQWIAFKLMKNRNRLKNWIANMICSVIFWLHGFHTFPTLADNGPTISVASSVLQSSDNYFQEISSIFLSVTMEKRAEGKILINCLVGWYWLVGWFAWLVGGWIWLLGWLVDWLVGWLIGWLVGCVSSFARSFVRLFVCLLVSPLIVHSLSLLL